MLSVAENAEATATVLEQAREAGAGRAVIGAIVREGDFVRASLKLLDTAENQILWGAQEEASSDELPSVAKSMAQAIAKELNASPRKLYGTLRNLTGGPEMSVSRELAEAVAARKNGDPQATLNAAEQLLRRFPGETAAHVHRSSALYGIWFDDRSAENTQRLEESLAVLDSVDSGNPYSEIYRGFILTEGPNPQFQNGIQVFSQVLRRDDLTPEVRAWVLYNRGGNASILGQTEASIQDFEEAVRLDPLNSTVHVVYAGGLTSQGRFEEAKLQAEQALLLNPVNMLGQYRLGMAVYYIGDVQSAAEILAASCMTRATRRTCALCAASLHRLGRNVEATEFANLAAAAGDTGPGNYNLARYWALTGDVDESLRYLRHADGPPLPLLPEDPDFSPLHGNPEFEAIVAEVKKRIGEE